jgi:trans-aconitate methyltransferase
MSKWKEIWNKDERVQKIILETLIKADGFDSGAGSFTVDDWITYTDELYTKIEIKKTDNIYDIGCGSGAFVYPLYLRNHIVGGLDYSTVLIDLANTIMPSCDFSSIEAINMDTTQPYNVVVSHSVFHYFKNLDYAKSVISKMVEKSTNKIAIFDINDESKKEDYHKLRMANMNKDEYEEKYKGLEHMFYSKEWFKKLAKEFNLKITIFDQSFINYSNSKLRFNVVLEKKN